jgi:hypothetical protein
MRNLEKPMPSTPPQPGTMVYGILDRAVGFFQEPKNRERIQTQCIDPLIRHILDRIFPYLVLFCILFSIILLMSLTSVALLVFQMRQSMVAPVAAAAVTAVIPTSG